MIARNHISPAVRANPVLSHHSVQPTAGDLPLFDQPRLVVRDLAPAAPDGESWLLAILSVARNLARERGSLTPSALRLRADTLGLKPPAPCFWGSVWARLRAEGWKRGAEVTSTTATRNAAREAVWTAPEVA